MESTIIFKIQIVCLSLSTSLFDKVSDKFQLKLKDRTTAANILGDLLRNVIKKEDERGYHLSFGVMP
jgi:hypothetical protein